MNEQATEFQVLVEAFRKLRQWRDEQEMTAFVANPPPQEPALAAVN
jgi:hypothetical protein